MRMHTWEDPEINQIQTQNQAKQDDWSKETQKKCPIKVIQTTTRARLSLWSRPCVYPHVLYCFPPNKYFTCFTSFRLYVEIHVYTADGPGPCHWPLVPGGLVAGIQRSHCRCPTSISGWEPKSCFKPLQAEATQDQVFVTVLDNREALNTKTELELTFTECLLCHNPCPFCHIMLPSCSLDLLKLPAFRSFLHIKTLSTL